MAWFPQRIYEFADGQLVVGAQYPGVGEVEQRNFDAREALAVAPFDHDRMAGLIRYQTGASYDGRGSIEAGAVIGPSPALIIADTSAVDDSALIASRSKIRSQGMRASASSTSISPRIRPATGWMDIFRFVNPL